MMTRKLPTHAHALEAGDRVDVSGTTYEVLCCEEVETWTRHQHPGLGSPDTEISLTLREVVPPRDGEEEESHGETVTWVVGAEQNFVLVLTGPSAEEVERDRLQAEVTRLGIQDHARMVELLRQVETYAPDVRHALIGFRTVEAVIELCTVLLRERYKYEPSLIADGLSIDAGDEDEDVDLQFDGSVARNIVVHGTVEATGNSLLKQVHVIAPKQAVMTLEENLAARGVLLDQFGRTYEDLAEFLRHLAVGGFQADDRESTADVAMRLIAFLVTDRDRLVNQVRSLRDGGLSDGSE